MFFIEYILVSLVTNERKVLRANPIFESVLARISHHDVEML